MLLLSPIRSDILILSDKLSEVKKCHFPKGRCGFISDCSISFLSFPMFFYRCFSRFPRPSFRHQAIQLPPSLSVLDVSRSCPNCPWTLWQWQCLDATTCYKRLVLFLFALEVTGNWIFLGVEQGTFTHFWREINKVLQIY